MQVLVPLAAGVEEIEAVTIIDVLRRGGVTVETVSLTPTTDVAGAHNIHLTADTSLEAIDPTNYDAIILPGGEKGTQNLAENERLIDMLHYFNDENKWVCAICAAPSILIREEIVERNHITYYPSLRESLDYPSADVPAVVDANIITGRGPGDAMVFALAVLQQLTDDETASTVADQLLASF